MKTVIGIIGPIAAGKDTAAEYIAEKLGTPIYQISSPLKEICQTSHLEPTRENLIRLGTELAATKGDGFLAEYLLNKTPQTSIIAGMRQLGQIRFLQEHANLVLISIDASPTLRFARAQHRAKAGEAKTLDAFIANEQKENSPPNTQRLFECMKLADYTIVNEGSVKQFYREIDSILKKSKLTGRLPGR